MVRRILVLAVGAALVAPAGAASQWGQPVSLTGDAGAVFRPQVTFAGRGDKLVAYGIDGRFAWSWTPPGQVGPFHTVTTTTADPAARLLTYGDQRVLLVSRTSGRLPWDLRARFGTVGGGVGAVRRLAPGQDVLRYDAATDARGDAVVAYVRNVRGAGNVIRKRVIGVVRRPAGGSFGRPETIVGTSSPTAVGTAVGPRGEVVVAYERAGRLEVRRHAPGGAWTAPQVVGPAVKGDTQIAVAAGGDGSFVLAWFTQALSEGGDNGPATVRVALRGAGGQRFHTARTFETFAERAPQDAGVRLAVAPDGSGVLGWTGRQAGHFVARVADVHGIVGQTVSDPTGDAVLGGVAAGSGGAGAAVWAPPLDSPSPQVFAAVRAGGGLFGAPETVSPPYREVATPAIGLDPRTGRPLAAWVARTGQRTQAVLAALRS